MYYIREKKKISVSLSQNQISLTGSSVGLGSCLTKVEVPGSSLPGGHWGIPQFTGEVYPIDSSEPLARGLWGCVSGPITPRI